jgi:hypothetical protein
MFLKILFLGLQDKEGLIWLSTSPGVEQIETAHRRAPAQRRYACRQSDTGVKVALFFVLFHQRLCGPLANSLFHHQPEALHRPRSKIETAIHKAGASIRRVLQLLRRPEMLNLYVYD